jgi:phage terminase small subunit
MDKTESLANETQREISKQNQKHAELLAESNKLLIPPDDLSDEEKQAWLYIAEMLRLSTRYIKTMADVELLRQYTQVKIMRDRAWMEWNKKPERYIRIVTGICNDGQTPKVVIKENEHYKIVTDCNKQIEKLLTDMKLTPKARSIW